MHMSILVCVLRDSQVAIDGTQHLDRKYKTMLYVLIIDSSKAWSRASYFPPNIQHSNNHQRNELFSYWKQAMKFSYSVKFQLIRVRICLFSLCCQFENTFCIREQISLSVYHTDKEYTGYSEPWKAAYGKIQSIIGPTCS